MWPCGARHARRERARGIHGRFRRSRQNIPARERIFPRATLNMPRPISSPFFPATEKKGLSIPYYLGPGPTRPELHQSGLSLGTQSVWSVLGKRRGPTAASRSQSRHRATGDDGKRGRARRRRGAAGAAAAAMGVMEKLKIFVVKEPVVAASCLIAGFGTRPIPSPPLWPKP